MISAAEILKDFDFENQPLYLACEKLGLVEPSVDDMQAAFDDLGRLYKDEVAAHCRKKGYIIDTETEMMMNGWETISAVIEAQKQQ